MYVVRTMTDDERSSDVMFRSLIDRKLAACCQRYRVESLYWWEGKTEEASEVVLEFKTSGERLDELIEGIKKIHPYDLPVIEWIKVSVDDAVEDWAAFSRHPAK
jgi:periplasmic divalent cation tolerance protein